MALPVASATEPSSENEDTEASYMHQVPSYALCGTHLGYLPMGPLRAVRRVVVSASVWERYPPRSAYAVATRCAVLTCLTDIPYRARQLERVSGTDIRYGGGQYERLSGTDIQYGARRTTGVCSLSARPTPVTAPLRLPRPG
eukprot:3251187-Rhodomonas_salina.1